MVAGMVEYQGKTPVVITVLSLAIFAAPSSDCSKDNPNGFVEKKNKRVVAAAPSRRAMGGEQ